MPPETTIGPVVTVTFGTLEGVQIPYANFVINMPSVVNIYQGSGPGPDGTVSSVNGQNPDVSGNVALRAQHVPADDVVIPLGEDEDPAVFPIGDVQAGFQGLYEHLVPIGGALEYLSSLTEHLVSSIRLVLDASAEPRAGVYTTWDSMMEQVARINGPVEISIPNGFLLEPGTPTTYHFPDRVTFLGNGLPKDLSGPEFTINGAKFTSGVDSFLFTDGLSVYQLGTEPIIEMFGGDLVVFLNGASLSGEGLAIKVSSGATPATIAIYLGSRVYSTGSPLIETMGLCVMSMGPGAIVDPGVLTGAGALVASYISDASSLHQAEQPGVTGPWIPVLQADARFTMMVNPASAGLNPASDTVDLAIRELAARSSGGAPMPSAPVGSWFNAHPGAVNTGTTGSPGTNTSNSNNRAVLQYQTFGEDIWVDGASFYLGATNDGPSAGASLVVWKANGADWHGPGEVIPFPSAKSAISGPVAEKTMTWSTPVMLPKEGFWYGLVFHDLNTSGTNPSYWCHAVTTPLVPRPGYSNSPPQGNTRTPILVTTVAGGVPADNPVVSGQFVNSNINIPAISFRRVAAP